MLRIFATSAIAALLGLSYQNCSQSLPTKSESGSLGDGFIVSLIAVDGEGLQASEFIEASSVTFIASHNEIAGANFSYVFSVDRGGITEELASSSESSFDYGPVSASDNGVNFYVTVSFENEKEYTQSFEMLVLPASSLNLNFYLTDSSGAEVPSAQAGTPILLNVDHETSGQEFSYSWYQNDELLANTNENIFDFGMVQIDDNDSILKVIVTEDSTFEHSAEMNLAVTVANKTFTWVFGTTCIPGTIDAQLADDTDSIHRLSESGGSGASLLCATGITDVVWAATCPAGYVDTGVGDDNDDTHDLNESGPACMPGGLRWCMQGISEVLWAAADNCPAGWAPIPVFDDNDTATCLTEGDDAGRVFQLCVR